MKHSTVFSIIVLTIASTTCCIASASAGVLPDKFATAVEAFPQDVTAIDTKDLPSGSSVSRTIKAPYADVFRVAVQSATQAMLLIESSDKAKGLIMASKSAMVRNPFNSPANQSYEAQRKYFFAIIVKEHGPTETEVTIIAKVQTSCQFNFMAGKKLCAKEATVSYAHDKWHSAESDLNNFFVFLNNNLMAAGLI